MDDYLELSNMTRNAELELLALYDRRSRIQELSSASQRVKRAELLETVSSLEMEIENLRADANNGPARQAAREELEKTCGILRSENGDLSGEVQRLSRENKLLLREKTDTERERLSLEQQKNRLLSENGELERSVRDMRKVGTATGEKTREAFLLEKKELELSNRTLSRSLEEARRECEELRKKEATGVRNVGRERMLEEEMGGLKSKLEQKDEIISILRDLVKRGEDTGRQRSEEGGDERSAAGVVPSGQKWADSSASASSDAGPEAAVLPAEKEKRRRGRPPTRKDGVCEEIRGKLGFRDQREPGENKAKRGRPPKRDRDDGNVARSQALGVDAAGREAGATGQLGAPKTDGRKLPFTDIMKPGAEKADTAVGHKKAVSKIDSESFFANLTFSNSSPYFKK